MKTRPLRGEAAPPLSVLGLALGIRPAILREALPDGDIEVGDLFLQLPLLCVESVGGHRELAHRGAPLGITPRLTRAENEKCSQCVVAGLLLVLGDLEPEAQEKAARTYQNDGIDVG